MRERTITNKVTDAVLVPPLPGFFIGAHAAVEGLALLTRDADRVRMYFPNVAVIAPE